MIALKPLLLCLLAGSSSAFAVPQPKNVVTRKTVLSLSGGAAADAPPPDLKVGKIELTSLKRNEMDDNHHSTHLNASAKWPIAIFLANNNN